MDLAGLDEHDTLGSRSLGSTFACHGGFSNEEATKFLHEIILLGFIYIACYSLVNKVSCNPTVDEIKSPK